MDLEDSTDLFEGGYPKRKERGLALSKSLFDMLSCNIGSLCSSFSGDIFSVITELEYDWKKLVGCVQDPFVRGRHTDLFLQHFFKVPYVEYSILLFEHFYATLSFSLEQTVSATFNVSGKVIYGEKIIKLFPSNDKGSSTTLAELITACYETLTEGITEETHYRGKKKKSKKKRKGIKNKKNKKHMNLDFGSFLSKQDDEIVQTEEEFVITAEDLDKIEETRPQKRKARKQKCNLEEKDSESEASEESNGGRSSSKSSDKFSLGDQFDSIKEEPSLKTFDMPISKEKYITLANSLCENSCVEVLPKLVLQFPGCRFRCRWSTKRNDGGYNFERDLYFMKRYNQHMPSVCVELKYNTSFDEHTTDLDAVANLLGYLLGDLRRKYEALKEKTSIFIEFRKSLKKNFSVFINKLEKRNEIQFLQPRKHLDEFRLWKDRYLSYDCAHYLRSKICLTWCSPPHSQMPQNFNVGNLKLDYQSLDIRWTPAKDVPLNIIVCYGSGDLITMGGNSHSQYSFEVNIHSKLVSAPSAIANGSELLGMIGCIVENGQTKTNNELSPEVLEMAFKTHLNDVDTFRLGQNLDSFYWDKVSITY